MKSKIEQRTFISACQREFGDQNNGLGYYCEIFGGIYKEFKETEKTYKLTFQGINFTLEKNHRIGKGLLSSWDRYPPKGGNYTFRLITTTDELWRKCREIIKYLTERNADWYKSWWERDEKHKNEVRELDDEIEMLKNLLKENGIPVSNEWTAIGGSA